jgi:hypothetical protein
MSEPTLKGACVKCGEHVAFPESHAHNKVPCPHCKMMTPLIPGKQTPEGLFYKCFCNACWDKIEYHARLIGSEVPCPHCKQNTVLAAPGNQSRPLPSSAPAAAPAAVAPASSIAQKTPVEPMAAVHAAAAARVTPGPAHVTPGPKPVAPPPKPVTPGPAHVAPGPKPVIPAAKPVMAGGGAPPVPPKPLAPAPARAVSPDKPATLVDPPPGPMANPPPPPSVPRARVEAADAGRVKSRPKWLIPVAVGVGVLALVGVALVFILPKLRGGGSGPPKTEVDYLPGHRFQKKADTGVIYVVGVVTNRSAAQVFNVKVEFDLIDETGSKVGVAQDVKDVIEPHGTWSYSAMVPSKAAVEAQPKPITKD